MVLIFRTPLTKDKFDNLQLRVVLELGYRVVAVDNIQALPVILNSIVKHGFSIGNAPKKQRKITQEGIMNTATVIPGIKQQKAERLFAQYPSLKAIGNAPPSELEMIDGIGRASARTIHEFFH